MAESNWQNIGALAAQLALDAVLIQQLLDAATIADQQRFAALLAQFPEPLWALLMPLLPTQLRVAVHRVGCSLRVHTAQTLGVSLIVTPINLGYSALYGTTKEEESSITIEVVTVPAANLT